MVVLCGFTGGYSELGGGKTFLEKIRNDLEYKRITPATSKPKPKPQKNTSQNQIATISNIHSGITGKQLLDKIVGVFKLHEYRDKAKALIVFDDLDCKDIQSGSFATDLSNFEKKIKAINSSIEIIYFFAQPEIEIWFVYDKCNIFNDKVVLCKDLENSKNKFYTNNGNIFNSSKNSCNNKFSDKYFTPILNNHNIRYSKRNEGSEYLRNTNPNSVVNNDTLIFQSIQKLQNL